MKVYDLTNTTWRQLTLTSVNQTNVNTVAGQISPTNNIATVAGADSNITAVAGSIANVNTAASNIANINSVAGNESNINSAVSNESNINAVVSNASNINSVAGNSTNINSVAGSITNVNTVATNLASVNNFGEVYRIASSAPTTSLDLGDLYFDTTSNILRVYGSGGWQAAGSSVNGTSQRYHYDITGTPTSVTGADANGNTLAYDAGYVDVYVNGVRMSTADVTVTSGDTVTFTEALADGDEVDIVGYGTFSVATLDASNLSSGTVPSARVSGAYTGITSVGTLTSFASTGIDDNASSTAMTLDSSGNLLVGTAGTLSMGSSTTAGFQVGGDFRGVRTDGNPIMYLKHQGNNGQFINFYKDTASVGSIGSNSSRLFVAGDSVSGLRFGTVSSVPRIQPCNDTGTATDGVSDLGYSSTRFKDLYLSGGVYLGGTGSANYLDDYEEGTFVPVFADATSGGNTASSYGSQYGFYTKIGRQVTIHITLANINTSGMTGTNNLFIRDIPFAANSTTGRNVTGTARIDKINVSADCIGVVSLMSAGTTQVQLYQNQDNLLDTATTVNSLQSGVADMFISITYDTN
jgi:hypothetical protein